MRCLNFSCDGDEDKTANKFLEDSFYSLCLVYQESWSTPPSSHASFTASCEICVLFQEKRCTPREDGSESGRTSTKLLSWKQEKMNKRMKIKLYNSFLMLLF